MLHRQVTNANSVWTNSMVDLFDYRTRHDRLCFLLLGSAFGKKVPIS